MQRTRKTQTARRLPRLRLTAAIYVALAAGAVHAQDAAPAPAPASSEDAPMLEAIEVTTQKRVENPQKVPISLQVLGEKKLDELNVTDFEDYAKFLPSVSYLTAGPGFAQIYMRGVASGGDGNHSGSLPSVGVYLDEMPVTTIQGPLDIHIYDIERVEALAGPQGTLYGASAQAGALRIITNKPDPSAFASNVAFEVNTVKNGGLGYVAEGMVNIPLSESAAIRLVGWHQRDSGYIDNVETDRQFPQRDPTNGTPEDPDDDIPPSWGGVVTNRDCTSTDLLVCTGLAEDNYNDVSTTGARAALRLDFNDNWSITPMVMGQHARAGGNFAFDEDVGDLETSHWYPEESTDRWWSAALTVEGKIGSFDLTYNYAHLKRDDDVESDYSDYSFWYDTLYYYNHYNTDGDLINPSQFIQGKDRYTKTSHELRIASPAENRVRFVGGLFWQNHFHDIEQAYKINGLSDDYEMPGWPDTLWLTKQERRDHDEAIFGELSVDFIPDVLTATAGARHFRAKNNLRGFFGFSAAFYPDAPYGEQSCIDLYGADPTQWQDFNGAPCQIIDKTISESGTLGKFNLSWNVRPGKMVYFTWSEGYRPGGNNRRAILPPYLSDYLTNFEVGWKTTWMDNRVMFNGSVFRQEWKDFQFSIIGANGLTEIKNANQARIDGLEMSLDWAATYNLRLGAAVSFYDAQLTENYCGKTDDDGNPITVCPVGSVDFPDGPQAPEGTQLPVTPKFKGNATARYTWDVGESTWFVQGAYVHVGERTADLRLYERAILGNLDAYDVFDLSAGVSHGKWELTFYVNNLFDERAQLSHFTQCNETLCGNVPGADVPGYQNGQVYTQTNTPRMFGIRWSTDF